jgi:ATP-dependent RNA/DNA helicase IGHMBP2
MDLERSIAEFADAHRRLLNQERQAEIEETRTLQESVSPQELERMGLCLLRLAVANVHTGLGGRAFVELTSRGGGELDPGRMTPGDIVSIRSHGAATAKRAAPKKAALKGESRPLSGVVSRRSPRGITVVLEDLPETFPDEPLRLDRVANDVTYRRLREALERLKGYRGGPAQQLRKAAFGGAEPGRSRREPALELPGHLDVSQQAAVRFALQAEEMALIHGPPGTGKTTTVVEIIRQSVLQGERVLACAPSNVAVDNLVERLVAAGVAVVRMGHPARLLPSVLEHSLDYLVERSEGAKFATEARRELEQAFRRVRRARDWNVRADLRAEIRRLRGEVREFEKFAVAQVLDSAEVILTTTVGAADGLLAGRDVDLVVVDEAAQALEASAWIPLLKGKRAVLCGDHLQLPPTICSPEAAKGGLGVTLFERLAELHGDDVTRLLTIQYRMHERIMAWSSNALYDGKVTAHESVRGHLLGDLPSVTNRDAVDLQAPVLLIDTAGCDFEELEEEARGASKSNSGEVGVVAQHVERLIEAGLAPGDIAVIAPYSAQVARLRERLLEKWPGLEVGTVDGFQGREKEAVIISMVRSNAKGEVGFLADERRMNVAVTRARRHVAIIGDSATVSRNPFLEGLVRYCEEHGEYRSAWEYK